MPIRQDPIVATFTPTLKAAFARTVSTGRWTTYLIAAGRDENRALRLNLWNAAVGQSFHFPLQTVEVALRNVSNDTLIDGFGANWCLDQGCRGTLGARRCEEIDKAVTRLRHKYGRQPKTDQIVASLTLGFWAALLHKQFHGAIWAGHVMNAFPGLTAQISMKDVSRAADDIQDLRNRIFHHEPLIGRNLMGDYGTILRLLGWICPETRDWVRKNSSVPVVMRMRPR